MVNSNYIVRFYLGRDLKAKDDWSLENAVSVECSKDRVTIFGTTGVITEISRDLLISVEVF